MGILTIDFGGIAIHMTEMNPYRIIIPSGPIPHGPYTLTPTITFPQPVSVPCLGTTPDPTVFLLNGATFVIGDGGIGGPDVNIACALHLRDFPFTPPLNLNAVSGEQAPAAAYFDIRSGSLTLNADHAIKGVVYAQLTVEFPGDEATIGVRCWNGGTLQPITIQNLSSPILVSNLPSPQPTAQDAHEYLGNFLIFEPMSSLDAEAHLVEIDAALGIQKRCLAGPPSRFPMFDTFPSCSNSQWP